MLRFYGYATCDSCRKAIRFLQKREIPFESIPIVERPPTVAELKRMLGYLGGDLRRLFNTSGQAYREMKLSEKLPSLSEKEALGLLARNGKLVKRPFVLTDRSGWVGFDEKEWKSSLAGSSK